MDPSSIVDPSLHPERRYCSRDYGTSGWGQHLPTRERKRSDLGEWERVEAGDRERHASRWGFASPRGIGNGRAGEQDASERGFGNGKSGKCERRLG